MYLANTVSNLPTTKLEQRRNRRRGLRHFARYIIFPTAKAAIRALQSPEKALMHFIGMHAEPIGIRCHTRKEAQSERLGTTEGASRMVPCYRLQVATQAPLSYRHLLAEWLRSYGMEVCELPPASKRKKIGF